jgi:CXXC-20-CXXC protein
MQKCLKCNAKFEKRQIRDSIFSLSFKFDGYKDVKCNHCGEEHKVRIQTRIVTSLLMTSPLIAKIFFGYAISSLIILPAFIFSLSATVYFVPYFAWYKLKK